MLTGQIEKENLNRMKKFEGHEIIKVKKEPLHLFTQDISPVF
jgi:hypothetical protein